MLSRRAYTLIEIIIVLAIILVLVVLVFFQTFSVRERAKTVKCGDNLRKIGVATSLYILDRQGDLFSSKSFYTPANLGNYLELPEITHEDSVFTCPSLKEAVNGSFSSTNWHNRTYSINYYILPDTNNSTVRNINSMEHFPQMMVIADGVFLPPDGFSNTITPEHTRNESQQWTLYPHNGLNHILFGDGHVEGVTLEAMRSYNAYSPIWGRARL